MALACKKTKNNIKHKGYLCSLTERGRKMDVSKWGFIPSNQIVWFEEDMQERSINTNPETDDMYER